MEPIKINDDAVAMIKARMAENPEAKGLRLTIKTTGCSGNSYQMGYAMDEDAGDDRFEKDGAVLYVPKTNSWMLFGMEIGYKEDVLESGFTFSNPNETGRCGCGESFSIDRPKP